MHLWKLMGAAALLTACTQANEPDVADVTETETVEELTAETETPKVDYTNTANWLCHPDLESDACDVDLTTTVVEADVSTTIEPYADATDPDIDCFYVYPTVSNDETPNSDMIANEEELRVIEQQFARFGSVCRLYAPLYRQVTLTTLREFMTTGEYKGDSVLNYNDVKDAWETYLAEENDGRGVIILGHSQGAGLIAQLAANELVGTDVMDRVISVMPIGTNVYPGEDGEYALPACTAGTDTGCMVAYMTFRGDREPPAISRFGKKTETGGEAMCVNPGLLTGDDGELHAYLARRAFAAGVEVSFGEGITVETPFVSLPGMLSAECRANDTHTWLAVDINGDPNDPRADDISGDVVANGVVLEDWGLHLIDMNVAMGNLLNLAETQADSWRAAQE